MRGATPDFATRTMAGAPDQRRDLSPVADQTSRHTGGNRTSPQYGPDSLLACGESGSCLPGSGCLSEGGDRGAAEALEDAAASWRATVPSFPAPLDGASQPGGAGAPVTSGTGIKES